MPAPRTVSILGTRSEATEPTRAPRRMGQKAHVVNHPAHGAWFFVDESHMHPAALMRDQRRPRSRMSMALATVVFMLFVSSGIAAAQDAVEVPAGDKFTLQNATECAPSTDVAVFLGQAGEELIGVGITDTFGHFSLDVSVPAATPLGEAIISVECGMEENVLVYDVLIVESTSVDLLSYAPYLAGVLAAVLIIGSVIGSMKRRSAGAGESRTAVEVTSPTASVPVPDDEEDDPDYSFWDVETERGTMKRLACLTDEVFYLHEIDAESFNALLEKLAVMGPDDVLRTAFLRIDIADIDEVRHRGTSIRIRYRTETGMVSKTMDLSDGAREIVGFLSTRVPVIADDEVPADPIVAPV